MVKKGGKRKEKGEAQFSCVFPMKGKWSLTLEVLMSKGREKSKRRKEKRGH